MASESNALPLAGIRVLEVTHHVAGPAAGMILADLGADVIKIEPPPAAGHDARGAYVHYFPYFNRNKRSLALDLKAAPEVFLQLVESADVVIENLAPGAMDRLGLGHEQLRAVNERIITLSIKMSLPGPYAHRVGFDELAQMMGGLAFMTGPPGQPLRAGSSVIDIGTAMFGAIGILAALERRHTSGVGEELKVGLFETTTSFVGQWMAHAAITGQPSVPMPAMRMAERMRWGIYDLFETADDRQVMIAITTERHWARFAEALELGPEFSRPDLSTNDQRMDAREWIVAALRDVLRTHTCAEIVGPLERAGVPVAELQRPDELHADPHLNAADQLLDTMIAGGGTAKLPKLPFRAGSYDFQLYQPAPELGQHSQSILAEIGLPADEIQRLADSGTIS